MATHSEQVMAAYNGLVAEITRDVRRLREEYGRLPCPTDCFKCCRNTATMPISEVEARDLKRGLDALPQQIRRHIRKKAGPDNCCPTSSWAFTRKDGPGCRYGGYPACQRETGRRVSDAYRGCLQCL